MNKAEFLHILRERLSILDENELEDILSEYEQHIDLKAAGTMTEEAAIADFGDIGELTAEMYAAGHSFFTYMSDNADSLSSCCRLRNEIQDNGFSYTLGAGAR